MCDCKSYNSGVGTVPEKILTAPKWSHKDTICIDTCIVDVITHLWKNGVVTLGSCCGHNTEVASVVLGEGESDYDKVIKLVCAVDGTRRDWEIQQWQLVTPVRIVK